MGDYPKLCVWGAHSGLSGHLYRQHPATNAAEWKA